MKITRQRLQDWEWIAFEDEMTEEEIKEFKIQMKLSKLENLKKEISETIIEFKWWKFKIRKKDIWEIWAYFEYADKTSLDPVHIFDSEYNIIPMTYNDFIQFWQLVWAKKMEIRTKHI